MRAKKMCQDGSAEFISTSVIRPAPHSQNLGIYDGDACIAQSAPAAAIAVLLPRRGRGGFLFAALLLLHMNLDRCGDVRMYLDDCLVQPLTYDFAADRDLAAIHVDVFLLQRLSDILARHCTK